MAKNARETAREMRRAEYRRAQELAARRRRTRMRVVTGIGALVIAGLVAAIVTVVVTAATRKDSSASATQPLVTPAKATPDGAIVVGDPAAAVKVDLYVDYMCPSCGRFEKANSTDIDRLVTSGKATLRLHPLSFLDRMSKGTRYSTRAANAVVTVADRAPDKLLAFGTALFDNQPEENSSGLSDARIARLATGAGVPQQVVDAFGQHIFEPWLARSTDAAFKSGIEGTPTIKINGTVWTGDPYTAGPFTRAVEAAGGKS